VGNFTALASPGQRTGAKVPPFFVDYLLCSYYPLLMSNGFMCGICVCLFAMQPIVPDAAADSLGISPHKDAGFLTVLVQDSTPGLQVCRQESVY
jgi:hypothetical protein